MINQNLWRCFMFNNGADDSIQLSVRFLDIKLSV